MKEDELDDFLFECEHCGELFELEEIVIDIDSRNYCLKCLTFLTMPV